jgi:hypothetical protein
MTKVKKIPFRVCLGCQEKRPKKELIRLVRTPEGIIEIDPTGKKAGRGAYVCPGTECIQKAIKVKRLERTFGQPIPKEIFEALKAGILQR